MQLLQSQPRTSSGTRASWAHRAAGRIPATICGQGEGPEHFTLNLPEFETVLRHHERVLDIELSTGKQRALIQEVQYDHLGDTICHIDFLRLVIGQKIEVEVPLEYIGHAKGQATGELVKMLNDIPVRATPSGLPESIQVKINDLDVDESITVGDLVFPEGVESVLPPEDVVCTIKLRAEEPEEEAEAPAEGESSEPEVIGKTGTEGDDASSGSGSDAGSGSEGES